MTTTTRRNARRKQETGKGQEAAPQVPETGEINEAGNAFATWLTVQGIGTAPAPIAPPVPTFTPPVTSPQQNNVERHPRQKNGSKSQSTADKDAPASTGEADTGELPVGKTAEKSGEKTADKTPAARYTVTIHEMPSNERPRERLTHFGPSALSTTELLAIQLRIGTRERSAVGLAELLLSEFEGLRGVANASVEQLSRIKGIGPVKAVEIAAAVELGKRLAALSNEERPCIRSPQDVANLLMPEMRDLKKEHLKSLLLDSKNRVMKILTVSVGILDSSLVHPREVFKDAILASSASLIIAHNHPSGDPTPSPEDKRITQRLYEAGQIIGIDLLDHIVIGDNRWISLKERGVI